MWVIAEQENGQLMNVTFELLGAAKELCAKLEEKCCAVLVTAAAGELPQQLIAAGADVVYVVEDAKYADYDTELYTDAICQLSKKYDPASIMFGATDDGRDLAPRVAARLHTGLCADCTALDVTDDKLVAWTRPALGGNICATISAMLTVRKWVPFVLKYSNRQKWTTTAPVRLLPSLRKQAL